MTKKTYLCAVFDIAAGAPGGGGASARTHDQAHSIKMTETLAFRMRLKPGAVAEYRRRHEELWPDLAAALREAGIYDYSIFLDEETLHLFAVLKLRAGHKRDELPKHP